MPRPPLPPGTAGQIKAYRVTDPRTTSKRWRARCRYRDHSGNVHHVSRYASSKERAIMRLRQAVKDWTPGSGTEPSVADIARAWFAKLERDVAAGSRSPRTLTTYRQRWDSQLASVVGNLKPQQLTTRRVDDVLHAIADAVSADTARTCRNVLTGVVGHAMRQGWIDTNPVKNTTRISGGRGSRSAEAGHALTAGEVHAVLRALDDDPRARRADLPDLARLYIATGARTSEILAVRWRHVDLDAGTVEVPGSKSPSALRLLPLPSWAVQILTERGRDDPDAPVFPSAAGTPRDVHNVGRQWRRWRERAGYGPWLTLRTFRRTVATVLDTRGETARAIAAHLGHAKPSITQDTYMQRRVTGRAAAEALENLDYRSRQA